MSTGKCEFFENNHENIIFFRNGPNLCPMVADDAQGTLDAVLMLSLLVFK